MEDRNREWEAWFERMNLFVENSSIAQTKREAAYQADRAKIEIEMVKWEAERIKWEAERVKSQAELVKWEVERAKNEAELTKRDKESRAELDRVVAMQKEISNQLGGMGNRHGKFAENFFFHALESTMQLGEVHYDEIEQNMRHKRKDIVDEFDIVMYNGNSVAIIEIKYCVTAKHLTKLKTQKIANFRWLYPDYQDYKIYLGIAGMSFENTEVLNLAHESGIATLEAKGDYIEIDSKDLIAY